MQLQITFDIPDDISLKEVGIIIDILQKKSIDECKGIIAYKSTKQEIELKSAQLDICKEIIENFTSKKK